MAPVAGLKPATEGSLQISGRIRHPMCHRRRHRLDIDSSNHDTLQEKMILRAKAILLGIVSKIVVTRFFKPRDFDRVAVRSLKKTGNQVFVDYKSKLFVSHVQEQTDVFRKLHILDATILSEGCAREAVSAVECYYTFCGEE
ncbi:hypothetical protein PoB_005135800 [Plakobranchus ocellatus]|uniref:Uncharacterized protein n=1 Tax=Plakobranchus ocellatus TaxID=259542 RepID=A0AAV4C1H8_9GAST|nr:hypothetical protein PoB_005135800 [Plakobranchus ocellatus]